MPIKLGATGPLSGHQSHVRVFSILHSERQQRRQTVTGHSDLSRITVRYSAKSLYVATSQYAVETGWEGSVALGGSCSSIHLPTSLGGYSLPMTWVLGLSQVTYSYGRN